MVSCRRHAFGVMIAAIRHRQWGSDQWRPAGEFLNPRPLGSNRWRHNGRPHRWLILRRIAQTCAVEAAIRGTDAGQRLSARQALSLPLVEDFGAGLQEQRRRVPAKSRLGETRGYIRNHRGGLQTFLTDGRVEIDSNRVENLIRPVAPNRMLCSRITTRAQTPGVASRRSSKRARSAASNHSPTSRPPPKPTPPTTPKTASTMLLPWNVTPPS